MSIVHIPRHIPADAERFKNILRRLFRQGSIKRLVGGWEQGYPSGEYLSAGLTRVPFIIICVEGSVEIGYLDNGVVARNRLDPGEAVFVKSNTWIHCNHSGAPLYLRITLDTDHTLFGCEQKTEYRPLTRESTERLELYPCPHLPLPHTRALIQRLESPHTQASDSPWALHTINLLLTDLYQLLFLTENEPAGKARRTWQAVRNYLQEHCGLQLNRKNVADAFRISPNHISRLFNEFSETGFNETLERMRMDKAVSLLRSSQLTVSEIAYGCGYSGANYFIRSFRKNYDMTPGRYREAMTAIRM